MRTLPATTLQDAEPHGSPDFGHRVESADYRGGRSARRHGTYATARHDRSGQFHRHGGDDPLGVDHQERVLRQSGHHSGAIRTDGHPVRATGRRYLHSGTGTLPHRNVHRRIDHDHRRCAVAWIDARPSVDFLGSGDAGERLGADSSEDVRKPSVLRRQVDRHGGANHLVRPTPRNGHRTQPRTPAAGHAHDIAGYSCGRGAADCRNVGGGRLDDSEYRPDRPRIQGYRRTIEPPRSAHHAVGGLKRAHATHNDQHYRESY